MIRNVGIFDFRKRRRGASHVNNGKWGQINVKGDRQRCRHGEIKMGRKEKAHHREWVKEYRWGGEINHENRIC